MADAVAWPARRRRATVRAMARKRRSQRRPPPSAAPAGTAPLIGTAGWALVPATLAVLVYLGSLDNPFVYDDAATVVENPSLREPLNWVFVLLFNRFRPIVNVSYALDVSWWGMRPFGFHLTNVLLHALAAALLFLLVRGWARDAARVAAAAAAPENARDDDDDDEPARSAFRVALTTAALFAVHPLMTEAVGYTSSRPEVLCAVFVFAALLLARRALLGGGARPWIAAGAAWLLALGSRENAAVVPIVLLAYDRLLRPGADEPRRRRLFLLYGPLLVAMLAAGALRVALFLRHEAGALPREVWRHFLTELPIYWRYLRLLLWPAGQSLVHPAQRVATPFDPRVLAAIAAFAALGAAAWLLRRRYPLVALGLLWFPLFLAPSSSLVPLVELMAEHRAYLASAGVFLVAGVGLDRLVAWWGAHDRRPARLPHVAALAILAVLGMLTMARNRVWADPVTLWRDAAAKAPLTWAPHQALGDALRDNQGCEAAIPAYRRAVELRPEDNRARINLGVCLAHTGAYAEAARAFEEALAVDPGSADAHVNLGWLASLAKRPQLAARHLRAALAREPANPVALANLAMLEETVLRNPAEALRLCRELLRAHPESGGARDCIARLERRLAGGA